MQIYGGIFAMELYWNHTSARGVSSQFAAFLQNTFSEQHLWRAASGHLHNNKKHTVSCFLPLSSVPLLNEDCQPYTLHSHKDSPYSHPDSPHSHHSSHSVSWSPIPAFTVSVVLIIFYKNLIVLHQGDNNFQSDNNLYQIRTFNNNPNNKEIITTHLMCTVKKLNHVWDKKSIPS